MINYKTEEEIQIIRESADILGRAHGEVAKQVRAGVKTADLDKIAEEYIRDHNAKASFKGYNGFPSTLCISVNENVVHGFPGKYELKDGDIISIDCGVFYKGFHSDSAYTYPVGEISPETLALLKATKESLYIGIEQAKYGNRLGDVSASIQKYVEDKGYTVPMVNLGARNIVQENDGWTIRTRDRKPSAHFEHTVAIFKDRTEVLTTHKYIEEVFKF